MPWPFRSASRSQSDSPTRSPKKTGNAPAVGEIIEPPLDDRDASLTAGAREADYASAEGARPVRTLLSVDGGGVYGMCAVSFLTELERHAHFKISELFDGAAGNSFGAIIVAAFFYTGKTGEELIKEVFNFHEGQHLMHTRCGLDALKILGPRFDGSEKRAVLHRHLPDIQFGSPPDKNLILVPVYDISRGKPVFFKSYDKMDGKRTVKIADVIDASSSFPGWYPAVRVHGSQPGADGHAMTWGVDGGLFANNPTDSFYADALELFPDHDVRVISVGCGTPPHTPVGGPSDDPGSPARDWPLSTWVTEGDLIDIMFYSPQEAVHERMLTFTKALGHEYKRVDERVKYMHDSGTLSKEGVEFSMELGKKFWDKHGQDVLRVLQPRIEELKKGKAWDRNLDGKTIVHADGAPGML